MFTSETEQNLKQNLTFKNLGNKTKVWHEVGIY